MLMLITLYSKCKKALMARARQVRRPPAGELALRLAKLSVSVAGDIGKALRYAAVDHDVSESAIVEVALRELLERNANAVSDALRQRGASKRRKLA